MKQTSRLKQKLTLPVSTITHEHHDKVKSTLKIKLTLEHYFLEELKLKTKKIINEELKIDKA